MALARLTSSCQEGDVEQAISACEDLVHDARRILAGLYERDLDASSPSEDSHGDADGNAGDEDGDEDGDDDDEDDDEDDDDGSGASEDDSQGDDDEEEVSSASDAESSGSDDSQGVSAADSSDDDLVPDYAGLYHPDRHCDRCDVYGHTNQYCPHLPAPKRRRV